MPGWPRVSPGSCRTHWHGVARDACRGRQRLAASKRSPLSFIPPGACSQHCWRCSSSRRLNMIQNTPRITSSSQAGMVAGANHMSSANAALTNGYSPLPSITEGQAYAQGLPMDRAGRAIVLRIRIRCSLACKAGLERGALARLVTTHSQGGTGWYDRLSTQEKYGYGPTTQALTAGSVVIHGMPQACCRRTKIALHVALRRIERTLLGSTQSRRNGSRITEISMAA